MNKKPAKTNRAAAQRNNQKQANPEKNPNGLLKIFSIFMLLLMAMSSFGRIATANHKKSEKGQARLDQVTSTGGGAASARVFVFQREDNATSMCEELVISATGNAVYSDCGKGVEKQLALSEAERHRVESWVQSLQPVNYDHIASNNADGARTQLYLNGLGTQAATEADRQRMISFAAGLIFKISSQS